jgi:hypothetical protein
MLKPLYTPTAVGLRRPELDTDEHLILIQELVRLRRRTVLQLFRFKVGIHYDRAR